MPCGSVPGICPQDLARDLEEASNEMLLADEDKPIYYAFGSGFAALPLETATQLIEVSAELATKRVDELADKNTELTSTLSTLRSEIYARLGQSVNLDEDEDDNDE
ncbi:hypothetical protein, variant [Fonticula alba]|uniref:Prefoldin subunit 4 n=1 Tax=Fonticula alba TaxID=691883 RepID=A0A058Z0W1_FONAL|nr:hypothetical protein, variant [Fonticula alba]KCV67776.1 hypothetical protein, variant [Fonticula alba]|eukprot:XP_009497807.1 hypothetical protein, variant [Fonticula alba]